MDLVPARPPGAAHRVRGHRRRDRGDQRRRRRPLPAQAVGAAGGEALPGDRRAARPPGGETRRRRRAQDQDRSATAGPRRRTRSVTSWPATRCRTGGTTSTEPDGQRLLAAAGATPDDVPVVITSDGEPLLRPAWPSSPTAVGLSHRADRATSTTWSSSEAGRRVSVRRCTGRRRVCGRCWSSGAATGGQAGQSSRIENYLGFPDGVSGDQLTERARRQASGSAPRSSRPDGRRASRRGAGRVVRLRRRQRDRAAHAVLLATGVSYRELVADGLADLVGRACTTAPPRPRPTACAGRARGRGRRRQLGRPGSRVLLPVRRQGDDRGAGRLAGAVDVAVPGRADRVDRQHRGTHPHDGRPVHG